MSRFHPEARLELFEALDEYESQRHGRGERFAEAVEWAWDLIGGQPK
jgi:hypothetical protein